MKALAVAMLMIMPSVACAAPPPDYLPEAEKSIADSVDPWGLPFSDALARYQERFAPDPDAQFALGMNHELVKILPNKYWYRGPSWLPGGGPATVGPFLAPAGERQGFQVVALPSVGAPEREYTLTLELRDAGEAEATIYRQVFVTTAQNASYPRMHSDRWPDPLVPENRASASGTDLAAYWVDVAIPADHPGGEIACRLMLSDSEQTATVTPIIRVVPNLALEPKSYPFLSWFGRRWGGGTLSDEQFGAMCEMALEHHMQPADALAGLWSTEDPSAFDTMHDLLAAQGQRFFDLRGIPDADMPAAYEHIRAAGWLDQCLLYRGPDEPDAATFAQQNIPLCEEVRQKYPGLRVYLASEYHPNMPDGCDIWMTDVSASQYDPATMRDMEAPELWHYYCHLPIHWQMRAPLAGAPNMEIDNAAIEHRLALWMSYFAGARGVFTWAGFRATDLQADFWETLTLSDALSGYPYGGVHNGNNFRVYPPREEGGPVLPSLRLKITRDALVDLALFEKARALLAEGDLTPLEEQRLQALLEPTPAVFVDFHYWNPGPAALLRHRDELLLALDEIVNH